MDWGAIISAASTVAAQTAAARAQANANKAVLNQANDRTAQTGYQTDKSLDLQALNSAYQAALSRGSGVLSEQAANLAAPGKRAANSVRGDALANLQDVQISGLPNGVHMANITGGLRPSMFSGNTRALGQQMSRQALLDQMAGDPTPFSDLKPLDLSSITARSAPGPTPLPQGNALDSILANIGMYGSMASAIAPALQKQPPYQEIRGLNQTVTPSTVT
jgi:hypothetical protein